MLSLRITLHTCKWQSAFTWHTAQDEWNLKLWWKCLMSFVTGTWWEMRSQKNKMHLFFRLSKFINTTAGNKKIKVSEGREKKLSPGVYELESNLGSDSTQFHILFIKWQLRLEWLAHSPVLSWELFLFCSSSQLSQVQQKLSIWTHAHLETLYWWKWVSYSIAMFYFSLRWLEIQGKLAPSGWSLYGPCQIRAVVARWWKAFELRWNFWKGHWTGVFS